MGRPQSTSGGRPHVMSIRLSDHEKAALEKARGSTKAPDYLRSLIPGVSRVLNQTPLPQQVAPHIPLVVHDAVGIPETVSTDKPGGGRHLHRFVKGDIVNPLRGIYHYTCTCGAEKEE